MPEDFMKHLISSSLDVVEMMRSGSDDKSEANLDTWNAVYGSVNVPVSFSPTELEELVHQIRDGDQGRVEQAFTELIRRPANAVMQDAAVVLARMLEVCCEWVDGQSGSESANEMLAFVRERLSE
jgi:hypothetical protein